MLESPYTRYPVYRDSLDEIIGVLHVRDLFSALHERGIAQVEIEELLRPVYIVPETKDLAALLAEFRKQNQHMAVVVDEYGAMQGIVTLEDLLEEIVGEIEDEFDLPDESVERIDDTHDPHRGHLPDRRLQRAVRDRDRDRGLPHDGRLRLRAARPRARGRRRGPRTTALVLRVVEVEGSRIQRLEVDLAEPLAEIDAAEEGREQLPCSRLIDGGGTPSITWTKRHQMSQDR